MEGKKYKTWTLRFEKKIFMLSHLHRVMPSSRDIEPNQLGRAKVFEYRISLASSQWAVG